MVYCNMSGLELIHKIVVQDERDFRMIRVPDGFKFEGEEEKSLIHHLNEKHKLYHKNPLDFSHSSLRYMEARNLFLPWLRAEGTDFTGARLTGCQFTYGYFKKAVFADANLSPSLGKRITSFAYSKLLEVNFEKANLQEVYFGGTDLSGANLASSYLKSADFTNAALCNVLGLDLGIDIEYAKIEAVTVTEKERKIIMGIKSKVMFNKVIDSHLN